MARPKGAKTRPELLYNAAKAKAAKYKAPSIDEKQPYTGEQILQIKEAVLELLESRTVHTLSAAGDYLGVQKTRLYTWKQEDPAWSRLLDMIDQIDADELIEKLDSSSNVIAAIFRLKRIRPEYRDTWHFERTSETLEALFKEIASVKALPQPTPALSLPEVKADANTTTETTNL